MLAHHHGVFFACQDRLLGFLSNKPTAALFFLIFLELQAVF